MGVLLADRVMDMGEFEIAAVRDRVLKLKEKGVRVINFASGDVSLDQPESSKRAEIEAIEKQRIRYPDPRGIDELRRVLVEKVRTKNRIQVNEDDIFVTSGALHGLTCILACILNSKLDSKEERVIVTPPYWKTIRELVRFWGGNIYHARLDENFQLDLDVIQSLVRYVKAIYINTPHNPTGKLLSKESLEGLAEISLRNNILVISDEPYEYITFGEDHVSIGSLDGMQNNAVTVSSFSKTASMTGLRVGYIVTKNKELRRVVQGVIQRTTYGSATISQHGAAAAFQDESYLERILQEYGERRRIMLEGFRNMNGVNLVVGNGTYYFFPNLGVDSNKLLELTMDRRPAVAFVPGDCFGDDSKFYDSFARFSFSAVNKDEIEEGMNIIREVRETLDDRLS